MSTRLDWRRRDGGGWGADLPCGGTVAIWWDDQDASAAVWWGRAYVGSGGSAREVELERIDADESDDAGARAQAEAELEASAMMGEVA